MCTQCAKDRFSKATGATTEGRCEHCAGGTFINIEGASSCMSCISSTKTKTGNNCISCPPGQVQKFDGSKTCEMCASGSITSGGHNHCEKCPANEDTRGVAGTTACHQIPRDCAGGEWTNWGTCSKKCGGGKQTRSRPVKTTAWGYDAQRPPTQCMFGDLNGERPCHTVDAVLQGVRWRHDRAHRRHSHRDGARR